MENVGLGTKKAILPLTGIRFLAALWVVMFHTLDASNAFVNNVIRSGYLGVPLFFVLSGFVLAYNYYDRLERLNLANFIRARFARIFPMLFVASLVTIVAIQLSGKSSMGTMLLQAIATITFIRAWLPMIGFNTPSWSLSAEAFFYVCFPRTAGYFKRKQMAKPINALFVMAILAVAIPVVLMAVTTVLHIKHPLAVGQLVSTNPIVRYPLFAAGIILFEVFQRNDRNTSWLSNGWLSVAGFGVVYLLVMSGPVAAFIESHATGFFLQAIGSGIATFPICALILTLACKTTPITRFFATKPLLVLGEASYSMYIVHVPLFMIFEHFVKDKALLRSGLPWLGFVAVLIVISILCFYFIEVPARRLLRPPHQKPAAA